MFQANDVNLYELLFPEVPVVLAFTMTTSQPCRDFLPELAQLAKKYGSHARIINAEYMACQQAAQAFNVTGVPTIFIGMAGNGSLGRATRIDGGLTEADLAVHLKKLL